MWKRAAILICCCVVGATAIAQETMLRSKSQLVLVPVSIAGKRGRPVRDLTEDDLVLYDNNVARRIQMEDVSLPISLAVVVQTTPEAQIVLDKLRKETSVIGPMITGDKGEAAVVAFGREVLTVQPFTSNEDEVANALRKLDATGVGGSMAEAVSTALNLLAARPAGRRRVLLLISEKHDFRSSNAAVSADVDLAQHLNVTVYSLAFSPSKSAWTNQMPKYCDPPEPAKKCRVCARTCGNCGNQCDRPDGKPQPFVPNQGAYSLNLGALIMAAKKATRSNVGDMLAKFTGGEQTDFSTRAGLDGVLERVSRDLHGQYLLSFVPAGGSPGEYRTLRVEVKGRGDLSVRFRPGYTL
ncbi:MAG: VWA domain-containing protein [Terriglobia bacterium]